MRTNQEYKNAALAALKGNWPQAIVATFIVLLLDVLMDVCTLGYQYLYAITLIKADAWVLPLVDISCVLVILLMLFFLTLPILLGYLNSFNALYYKSDGNLLSNLKSIAFHDMFRRSVGMLAIGFISLVCTLALVIPGIMASMALFLTPYLLEDKPELSIVQALRLSRKMMRGHKMKLFCLQLSFIGWILLSALTLGIGMLWLMPYMTTTMAAFYQDVREQYIMKEGQQESAL